jgi:hypothetical protein
LQGNLENLDIISLQRSLLIANQYLRNLDNLNLGVIHARRPVNAVQSIFIRVFDDSHYKDFEGVS